MRSWAVVAALTAAALGLTDASAAAQEAPAEGGVQTPPDGTAQTAPDGTAPAAGGPQLRLVAQSQWVTPEGELRLRLAVDELANEGEVELAVTVYSRLTSRSLFELTLEDRFLGSVLDFRGPGPLPPVDPATGGREVRVPMSELPLSRIQPDGVYPVRVELRAADDGEVIDGFTTHAVVVPGADSDAPPLTVTWVQPMGAPLAVQPDGSVALSGAERRRVATVADALARRPDVPLTVVPTPETFEALDQRPSGRSVVRDLAGALDDRQVVAGPWVTLPLAAMMGAGLDEEVAAQVARGTSVLQDLLGVRPDTRTWVTEDTIAGDALAALSALGVDQLVVADAALEPVDLDLTLTRPFELEGPLGRRQRAVVADSGLARHFEPEPGAEGDDVLRAQHLLADLAVLFNDSPGLERGVVVLVPDGWQPSADFLDTALRGLATSPILAPSTLDGLFERVPPAPGDGEGGDLVRRLVPAPRTAPQLDAARVEQLRDDLLGFASMVPPGTPAVDDLERRLLASEAEGLDESARAAYLDEVAGGIAAQASEVQAPDDTSIRLTAREGTIPLTFHSDADHPVEVDVRLDSEKLEFPGGSCPGGDSSSCTVRSLLLEEENTTIEVSVRARGPGSFPLTIAMRSPDGRLDVGATRVTVRSTAASGVGIVLTVGAGLFLVVWWGRQLRRSRRVRLARRLAQPGQLSS